MRRLRSIFGSRLAALIALPTLLSAPIVHSPLAHDHVDRSSETALDSAPASTSPAAAPGICPVCLAGAPVRTGIANTLPRAIPGNRAAIAHGSPAASATAVDLALAAPRAPPVRG